MPRQRKRELSRVGTAPESQVESCELLEEADISSAAPCRVTDHQLFDNRLICGDNLHALRALEQEFAGKIKCIYIDPPYNTGSAFAHYGDALDHARWLHFMLPRLALLWRLLRAEGFLAVQIDDNEFARLFLFMAEMCGEQNPEGHRREDGRADRRKDDTGYQNRWHPETQRAHYPRR